jgi:hypothetical protein
VLRWPLSRKIPYGLGVRQVEDFGAERVRVLPGQIGGLVEAADRADHPLPAFEQLLSELAAEAAADPGDQPRM